MSVWRLILREILYRKVGFGLAVLAVAVAVGCLTAALTLLRLHDLGTEQVIARKEAETQARTAKLEADTRKRLAKLEDDYRKITLGLGFNVLIVHKDQDLAELFEAGRTSKYLPESYATRLIEARVASINHLLPLLQEKIRWPERQRTILLAGTRGEVPPLDKAPKKPLLERVPLGTLVAGHGLKLVRGEKVRLLGQDFTVHHVHAERGTPDDFTAWINLTDAQRLLGRESQISAILALECNCAADRLHQIRSEIAAVLPDTQVKELTSQALARAEARNRAAVEAKAARAQAAAEAAAAVANERRARAALRQQQDALAAVLVPLVVLGCIVGLGVLTLYNVRERGVEIGILRALGLRSRQVFLLVLARVAAAGLIGAVLGYTAGVLAGVAWGWALDERPTDLALFEPGLLLLVLAATPALCALVGWLPAMLAARQDPAVLLREA
jgi:hypothetical protein